MDVLPSAGYRRQFFPSRALWEILANACRLVDGRRMRAYGWAAKKFYRMGICLNIYMRMSIRGSRLQRSVTELRAGENDRTLLMTPVIRGFSLSVAQDKYNSGLVG